MVGFGALLRWRLALDLTTLGKLNIYLFTPAFIFKHVSESKLPWSDMGGIVLITVMQVFTLGMLSWGIGRALHVSRKTLSAIALAVMFYNSGNYGLALAELAYPGRTPATAAAAAATQHSIISTQHLRKDGGAVQAFVVLSQNVLTFTVGLAIAASAGSTGFGDITSKILRLPVLYTFAAALLGRWWLGASPSHAMPTILAKTADFLSAGLVPVALVTLGVQLAANPRWPRWRPVSLAIVLRLIGGPIQMAALLWTFHKLNFGPLDLWPWPAELLVLTAAVPTAINTLLLTLELEGDTDLAADCVFWSTLFSCITITVWLVVLRKMFGS
jgi:hypothetical protein